MLVAPGNKDKFKEESMKELIFCMTPQEAQLLLDALVELPFRRSADLIFKIQKQAAEQNENPSEGEQGHG